MHGEIERGVRVHVCAEVDEADRVLEAAREEEEGRGEKERRSRRRGCREAEGLKGKRRRRLSTD